MISVWGGPWATKYLATPLGTHAILGAVISPEQRKYSQQWQEFFSCHCVNLRAFHRGGPGSIPGQYLWYRTE